MYECATIIIIIICIIVITLYRMPGRCPEDARAADPDGSPEEGEGRMAPPLIYIYIYI